MNMVYTKSLYLQCISSLFFKVINYETWVLVSEVLMYVYSIDLWEYNSFFSAAVQLCASGGNTTLFWKYTLNQQTK